MVRDKEPHAWVAALAAAGLLSFLAVVALGDLELRLPSLLLRNVVKKPVLFSGLGVLDILVGEGTGSAGDGFIVAGAGSGLACLFGMSVSDLRDTITVGLWGSGGGFGRASSA